MSEHLDLTKLQELVRNGAAARSRVTLQPAGGEGTKVFPPTYAGSVYATEKRRLPGYTEPVDCVLLDSVQSQANRQEEALQQAIDEGKVSIPVVEVDFTSFYPGTDKDESLRLLEPVGKVTSLQAPHRIVDAILRDSIVKDENKPFRASREADESSHGKRLRQVTAQNATTLFELCPTALLFGMWDSTGPKGGLGAKFERAMVSEIVGINLPSSWSESRNRGLRTDPLGVRKNVTIVGDRMNWQVVQNEKQKGGLRPSEIVHGNIPFESANCGVTIDRAEQTIVLSFPALRRLKFPIDNILAGKTQDDVNNAASTVLAALGLCAAALAADAGLDLRSRCLLWPTVPLKWELLGKPGKKEEAITLDAESAIKLLKDAIQAAKKVGLPWREAPLQLVPSDQLVKLVVKSQQLAQQQGEGAE